MWLCGASTWYSTVFWVLVFCPLLCGSRKALQRQKHLMQSSLLVTRDVLWLVYIYIVHSSECDSTVEVQLGSCMPSNINET